MRKVLLSVLVQILSQHATEAQWIEDKARDQRQDLYANEVRRYQQRRDSDAGAVADTNINVTYYKLDLHITTSPNLLRGMVTVKAVSNTGNLSEITLDLRNNMTVDSVIMGNTSVSFVQYPTTVSVNLNRSYGYGEMVALDIYYHGVPISTGFGSFEFGLHAGTPWVWTLSEPHGAKDWWPSKDTPSDKADSADIWVTCDAAFKVGSNGKLVEVVNNGNGTKTHKWSERYPISTYLVSIALTNYAEFSNWFHYSPTDSMQILNYVLPEHLQTALDSLPKTIDALTILSNLFGLYPFIGEKYGHSEFGRGGAMEHQTMTSTTGFSEYLIVHELAHQWFGDMITCANWQNIWLNEGFARYAEALYAEAKYGSSTYRGLMAGFMDLAKTAVGPLFSRDTTNIPLLFNGPLTYMKGATILHMLRHVLGDSVFFQAMRRYADDPRLRFSVATTEDFQNTCETVSGKQLGYFFREWIYGEKYPQYSFDWRTVSSGNGNEVTIHISQYTGTSNPIVFSMPIDFKLSTDDWDTTVVVFNSSLAESFTIVTSHVPSSVTLDPDGWILRDVVSSFLPTEYRLEQSYPNPFNTSTTIKYSIPPVGTRPFVSLKVYDVLGREVATLANEQQSTGTYSVSFSGSGLASGVYYYQLQAGGFVQTRNFILLK